MRSRSGYRGDRFVLVASCFVNGCHWWNQASCPNPNKIKENKYQKCQISLCFHLEVLAGAIGDVQEVADLLHVDLREGHTESMQDNSEIDNRHGRTLRSDTIHNRRQMLAGDGHPVKNEGIKSKTQWVVYTDVFAVAARIQTKQRQGHDKKWSRQQQALVLLLADSFLSISSIMQQVHNVALMNRRSTDRAQNNQSMLYPRQQRERHRSRETDTHSAK